MPDIYADDSFFTLAPAARAGLVLLSGLLGLGCILILRALAARLPRALARAGAAGLVFWAFLWLSPQVYYLYYLAIFDGLPVQWVISAPPGLHEVLDALVLAGPASLADHARAALGWALVVYAIAWPILPRLRRPRSRH